MMQLLKVRIKSSVTNIFLSEDSFSNKAIKSELIRKILELYIFEKRTDFSNKYVCALMCVRTHTLLSEQLIYHSHPDET